jgi:predicted phosphodiesterase
MRIELASDLHQEFHPRRWPQEPLIEPAPGADVLVLAGDVARELNGLWTFVGWAVPILYVAGNYESRTSVSEYSAR